MKILNTNKITNDWCTFFTAPDICNRLQSIENQISTSMETGSIIYPNAKNIFKAFELTSFENTKVVILGQDPYHGENQAHGLCFSVPNGIKIPPSLRNIYKELVIDQNLLMIPQSGNLESWAQQGVLLINSVLTVEKDKVGSHSKFGWQMITDELIKYISEKKENIVFILWGNYAIEKETLIDSKKHYIIKSVHPSPLSASRGFFGSKPFSKCNEYLKSWNISEINWASVN